MQRILFVDDDEAVRQMFQDRLAEEPFLLTTASSGQEALEKLETFPADVVITDFRMPGMDGLVLLEEIRMHYPDIFVVVVTGHGTIQDAVKAMKDGAYDYILKPFDFDTIRGVIEKISGHKRILDNGFFGSRAPGKEYRFNKIIGQDPKMFVIFQKIMDVAKTNATVLITGESGTGKELLAEAIHHQSARREGPLVKVNCAALTETLINSELFGHEKGAFTGAIAQKKGYFEMADGGTIFLDEIGDIPITTQISLLRILESGSFQRVGGTHPLKFDARFIFATNQDLTHAVKEKLFREDLYYRINVVSIQVPPLRERKSDIPLLANYYLKRYSNETGKKILAISRAAMNILYRYDWPGNVRELSNVLENAVIFCKGREITPQNLPQEFRGDSLPRPWTLTLPSRSLDVLESSLLTRVLEATKWNLKQAARELEIPRGTLYSKMRKHGIQRPT